MNRTKLLGDAGEHFATGMLSFAGHQAVKVPDNWNAFDIAILDGTQLVRVSVKTRSQEGKYSSGRQYIVDHDDKVEWFVLLLYQKAGSVRSWIVPWAAFMRHAKVPKKGAKQPSTRRVTVAQLISGGLAVFENNWRLSATP